MEKLIFSKEYNLNKISVNLLWPYISTPTGLATWFADDVTIDGKNISFFWAKEEHKAEITCIRQGSHIRFHWLDDCNPKSYFELKILFNELVSDVVLVVTDYAEQEDIEDCEKLWDEQITLLKKKLGA